MSYNEPLMKFKPYLKIIIFRIISPLLIGVFVYAVIKENPPFNQYIPWGNPLIDISFLPKFLYDIIMRNLIDALWAFSFVNALDIFIRKPFISASVVLLLTILFEACQYFAIINGTGDIWDVFYSLCALIIYLLFFKGVRKNEKEI